MVAEAMDFLYYPLCLLFFYMIPCALFESETKQSFDVLSPYYTAPEYVLERPYAQTRARLEGSLSLAPGIAVSHKEYMPERAWFSRTFPKWRIGRPIRSTTNSQQMNEPVLRYWHSQSQDLS